MNPIFDRSEWELTAGEARDTNFFYGRITIFLA